MNALCLSNVYNRLRKMFQNAGIETANLDARVLICHVTKLEHASFIARPDYQLQQADLMRIQAFADRRLAGEPVARIIGSREFYGREFAISQATLDPRPDSETLVEVVLKWVDAMGGANLPLRIADLGTGSGALLLSVLAELPLATGIGCDIDPDALAVAKDNAKTLGVADRAQFCISNWFSDLSGHFDIILSNPPYIKTADIASLSVDVRDYDPLTALDGGADGLMCYRLIAEKVNQFLTSQGLLVVETAFDNAPEVENIFSAVGLVKPEGLSIRHRDLAGQYRVVSMCAGMCAGEFSSG